MTFAAKKCRCPRAQRLPSATRHLPATLLHASASPTSGDVHVADSTYAWLRLLATLGLMTVGSSAMYVIAVVLPAVQADFGVARADA